MNLVFENDNPQCKWLSQCPRGPMAEADDNKVNSRNGAVYIHFVSRNDHVTKPLLARLVNLVCHCYRNSLPG